MTFATGRPAADILADLSSLRDLDPPTEGGRVLSYVYDPGIPGLDDLVSRAAQSFLPVNGLDPTTFTSVATLERDVVAFARHITRGDAEVVGSVTSGGTESCLLAVKSARDLWRREHGEGHRPLLIAPTTVHAAFHKACDYFDLTMVPVDVDPETGTVDPAAFLEVVDDHARAGRSPALAVLSAPNYPLGSIDDIQSLGPALAERGVPLHVDACVGGFVLPFHPAEVPDWDFRVEGVRSISLDVHKYGYAPKGASVVLYRGRENHRAQYFSFVDWPGYPVVNPTLLGSRSATALAAAWAIVNHLGVEGYRRAVARIARAEEKVRDTLTHIPGLKILGAPFGPLLAVAAAPGPGSVDPFHFIDALRRRGFLAQAQPAFRNISRSAHLTLTPVSADVADELCAAMVAAAHEVQGLAPAAPEPALLHSIAAEGIPTAQAEMMATLESLPPEIAKEALTEVLASVIDPGTP